MKTLCVYYSRTGLTKEIAKQISGKTGAELVEIATEEKYEGVIGYLYACIVALSKKMPEILPYKTEHPLEEYEKVIVCAPVWVEDACPAVRAFFANNKDKFKGDLCFVLTHMSNLGYEKKIENLQKLIGKKFSAYCSVQTKNYDWTEDINNFI